MMARAQVHRNAARTSPSLLATRYLPASLVRGVTAPGSSGAPLPPNLRRHLMPEEPLFSCLCSGFCWNNLLFVAASSLHTEGTLGHASFIHSHRLLGDIEITVYDLQNVEL
ncbi:hypothetical protein E2C01_075669 [Portunus trituberculatus]|uniref:Uncharacterized protein n=1 Tax=Portunus trituberculatus TaxID=210409 RepID=A0A5B7IGX7_PORTR|nr:hypothetical protein [Portunus trituberculatus]